MSCWSPGDIRRKASDWVSSCATLCRTCGSGVDPAGRLGGGGAIDWAAAYMANLAGKASFGSGGGLQRVGRQLELDRAQIKTDARRRDRVGAQADDRETARPMLVFGRERAHPAFERGKPARSLGEPHGEQAEEAGRHVGDRREQD